MLVGAFWVLSRVLFVCCDLTLAPFVILIKVFHLAQGCILDALSAFRKCFFDGGKATDELPIAFPQCFLGVDSPAAADVGQNEQHVAQFVFDTSLAGRIVIRLIRCDVGVDGCCQLGHDAFGIEFGA